MKVIPEGVWYVDYFMNNPHETKAVTSYGDVFEAIWEHDAEGNLTLLGCNVLGSVFARDSKASGELINIFEG